MIRYDELREEDRDAFDWAVSDSIQEGLIPAADPAELWTGRVCNRCGTPVFKEMVMDGYPYYCPCHDESLYGIETHEMEAPL